MRIGLEITARPKTPEKPCWTPNTRKSIPERYLLAKLLERSFLDIAGPSSKLREDAYRWLTMKGRYWNPKEPFGVMQVCEELNICLKKAQRLARISYADCSNGPPEKRAHWRKRFSKLASQKVQAHLRRS